MRTTNRTQLLPLIVMCLCAACASAGGESTPSYRQQGNAGQVVVTNDGNADFMLFMVRDGERFRLGRVSRMETARFRIPVAQHARSSQVALVAQPMGSGSTFATIPITWRPGQNLVGRVARNTSLNNFVLITR